MAEELATEECELSAAEPAKTPAHLIQLDEKWALWRWVAIRGAGFPIASVLKLAAEQAAAAADRILETENEFAEVRAEALTALRSDLHEVAPGASAQLAKIRKQIWRNERPALPPTILANNGTMPALKALDAAWEQLERVESAFRESFKADSLLVSEAIQEVAKSNAFREAVTWQNRHALHGSIDALIEMSERREVGASSRRRREEVVASYLQRYCAKNDTIGFFGPVGWGEIVTTGKPIQARPGSTLLAERNVYLEVWCVDELAKALAIDGRLRDWIAPRRASYIDLVGTQLYLPARRPINLPLEQAAALRACDGTRTARQIARGLIANPLTGIKNQDDASGLLGSLHQQGLIAWSLEVPIDLYPERSLRRSLERIEDEPVRQSALAALGEIEGARDLVAHADGEKELDAAIGTLENAFMRLTGSAATRSAGEMYAGRTLVYEDCRRDLKVEFGPQVTASLGPPLGLLLTSARWFTEQITDVARGWFDKLYTDISRRTRSRTVDFTTLWYELSPRVFGGEKEPLATILPLLQQKWAEVLSLPEGARRVEYTSEALRGPVAAAFKSPRPKWKSAIYHSPDIMIAAESVDAIERGDYQFVLGELHATVNTIRHAVFVAQHPSQEDLALAWALDHSEPRAVPLPPKAHWPAKSSRMLPVLVSPDDYRIEFVPEPANVPQSQVIPFGSLVVEDLGHGAVICTRDRKLQFDPLDILFVTPPLSVANDFKILTPAKHSPRITFDHLVVNRETWFFSPSEIEFAGEKDQATRFLAARRWARAHGIPRFAFVKSPIEIKPMFVDFDSPIYLNILIRVVRKSQEVSAADTQLAFSEMLPSPTQTWLPDASGQRYTSELRMVAVDVGN